jgi:hypothetical protein
VAIFDWLFDDEAIPLAGPLALSGTGTDWAHQIICALNIPGAESLPTSLAALSRKATP